MSLRELCPALLVITCLLVTPLCKAEGYPYPGQTVQFLSHFHAIYGNSIWTLILRDPASGRVLPYQYFFREDDNTDQSQVAFTTSPTYIILESKLQWGPFAVINNFCGLVDGVIKQQSLYITFSGDLSPDPNSFACHVMRYNNAPFTIGT